MMSINLFAAIGFGLLAVVSVAEVRSSGTSFQNQVQQAILSRPVCVMADVIRARRLTSAAPIDAENVVKHYSLDLGGDGINYIPTAIATFTITYICPAQAEQPIRGTSLPSSTNAPPAASGGMREEGHCIVIGGQGLPIEHDTTTQPTLSNIAIPTTVPTLSTVAIPAITASWPGHDVGDHRRRYLDSEAATVLVILTVTVPDTPAWPAASESEGAASAQTPYIETPPQQASGESTTCTNCGLSGPTPQPAIAGNVVAAGGVNYTT
jgi:hypothetical protein